MNRKAIVSGPLAAKPGNAGGAWERFSWAVGLRRLGFDVLFIEECVGVPSAAAGLTNVHVSSDSSRGQRFSIARAAGPVGDHGTTCGSLRRQATCS